MVTDQQVRRLYMLIQKEKSKTIAAVKSGMDPKTALKYKKTEKLPSQMQQAHNWRTRKDPFDEDWEGIKNNLEVNVGLEAKTIFKYLQCKHPGKYQDGQLRTLQRRIHRWRAEEGPAKEVFFPQVHYPGILCASDFTYMDSLGVSINGEVFHHLLYHFVLTYSNWETFTLCFSESYESLSTGLQNALWKLGHVPERHRTDRMSAAVNKDCNPEKFTRRYSGLLRHYRMKPERINARCANENGDIEQRHYRLKKAVDQALMLRGSRDFSSRKEYEIFLRKITEQLNSGREERFREELKVMQNLPSLRLEDFKEIKKRVGKSSTLQISLNTYSVHSRLIGETVLVKVYMDHLEIWYAHKRVEKIPRLRGSGKHRINYRHIIDTLIRKPGAFEDYRYKPDMFPSSYFRRVYDDLKARQGSRANKEYIQILWYAAKEGEEKVEGILRYLITHELPINANAVKERISDESPMPMRTDVNVDQIQLNTYDELLESCQEEVCYG